MAKPPVNVILSVVWDMKGPITFDFLVNGTVVNRASYFQRLMQNSHNFLNESHVYIHIYKSQTIKTMQRDVT